MHLFVIILQTGIGHSGEINRVKIAPDGNHIVSVSADGAIIRWKMPVHLLSEEKTSLEEKVEQIDIDSGKKGTEEKEEEDKEEKNEEEEEEQRKEDKEREATPSAVESE